MLRATLAVIVGVVALEFLAIVLDMFVGGMLFGDAASHSSMEVFIRFNLSTVPICAAVSAYITAVIARRWEFRTAGALAVITIAMTLVFHDARLPRWFDPAQLALGWAGLLAGAYLGSLQNRKLVG